MRFKINGIVIEKESGQPLSGLLVKAYDKDLIFDDLLGSALTDDEGSFQFLYEESDFQELFDKKPDIYLEIQNQDYEKIHTTEDNVRFGSGQDEFFKVEIPKAAVIPSEIVPGEFHLQPDYRTVDLRSLLIVLERSFRQGKIEQTIGLLRDFEKTNPGTTLLMPKVMISSLIAPFALFGLCNGTTAAATITLAGGTISSTTRKVGFTYTFTGAPTCSVSLASISVRVGGGPAMMVNGITDTAGTVSAKVVRAAGALPGLAAATISATFTASAGWCDTCTLAVPTVTTNVTIGP